MNVLVTFGQVDAIAVTEIRPVRYVDVLVVRVELPNGLESLSKAFEIVSSNQLLVDIIIMCSVTSCVLYAIAEETLLVVWHVVFL